MNTIKITVKDSIAVLALDRGKSNAINLAMIEELHQMIHNISEEEQIGALLITGKENFFSSGLDLFEIYDYDASTMRHFWLKFIELIEAMFSFKKPMVAAITGHSPAGGCVLALCADYRLMAQGKFVIGLNEVAVGIIVPDIIFDIYAFWIGSRQAHQFLLEGKLLETDAALRVGMIDEQVDVNRIMTLAEKKIKTYLNFEINAWQQSKLNIRKELIRKLSNNHDAMLDILLQQWWQPSNREILKLVIDNLKK